MQSRQLNKNAVEHDLPPKLEFTFGSPSLGALSHLWAFETPTGLRGLDRRMDRGVEATAVRQGVEDGQWDACPSMSIIVDLLDYRPPAGSFWTTEGIDELLEGGVFERKAFPTGGESAR